jgi:hypothetical protein
MMMSRMGRHRLSSLVVGLALIVISGCGGGDEGVLPTVRVSGTLAVDGKPVNQGTIYFHSAKGRVATGIVKDRKFTLSTYSDGDGTIAGKNRIAVEVVEEVPMKDGDTTTKSLIPVKFTNPDRSGLQLEIPESGYKNLQIDLKGESAAIKEE